MKSKTPFENGFSYLLASDFDQTLSFNDSGYVLCDLLGIHGFEQKVGGAGQIGPRPPDGPSGLGPQLRRR